MDDVDLLIIGGGPAGLAAARGYRAAGGDGAVAIVTDESRMPYHRPALTKELVRGEIDEAELGLATDAWPAENRVALVDGRALTLDPAARTVAVSAGRRFRYRTCVLATGGEPQRLPVPGIDDPAVRHVRTIADVHGLLGRLSAGDPVTVVGSGFIGCELAVSLRMRGHPVTMLAQERGPNVDRLGSEVSARIRGWLEDAGVVTHFDEPLGAIERDGPSLRVVGGSVIEPSSAVVIACGMVPRSELLVAAGLVGSGERVEVDPGMRTAHAGLLAAGDVCSAEHPIAGRPLATEHWGDALAQGEVAGRTAAGATAAWDAVPGFWSTIGRRTLKHSAWGDGHDVSSFVEHPDGGFTAWYGRAGTISGVLTFEADDDYTRGGRLIAAGASWPPPKAGHDAG